MVWKEGEVGRGVLCLLIVPILNLLVIHFLSPRKDNTHIVKKYRHIFVQFVKKILTQELLGLLASAIKWR